MPDPFAPPTETAPTDTAPAAPLGLYIHVPFCLHVCPYCDFYKVTVAEAGHEARGAFPGLVTREFAALLLQHADALRNRPLDSIYFGGGTPSLIEPTEFRGLLHSFRAAQPCDPQAEITIEISPETVTPERLEGWREAGINRLSIGLQSYDDLVLARLGRRHSARMARETIRRARNAGFQNLSLDLIFAVPGQTLAQWQATLEETIATAPEHISFYGLTIKEGTVFAADHAAGRLVMPGDDLQAEQYLWARQRLIEAGYEHYEISNFARPGYRARHNANYWQGGDWLGLGPGAHSSLDPWRWDNPHSLREWAGALDQHRLPRTPPARLTHAERWTEAIFLGLRRCEGIEVATLLDEQGRTLTERCGATLERLIQAGWLHHPEPGRLALTERGWLLADSVMAELI